MNRDVEIVHLADGKAGEKQRLMFLLFVAVFDRHLYRITEPIDIVKRN